MSLRVLGRTRLSVSTEESTSIERQRELIQQWADTQGHTIAGWAEDVDVSGSVDPFQTPALGEWLNHRADEFDLICCWKLDRVSRSAIRLNSLVGWCLEHEKTLVSCTEGIDIGTPVGRLIANVIAFLAEGELDAMKERQKASRRKLREAARWPGGRPPYGYRAVDTGTGKTLEIDPHAYPIIRRIVDAVLDGQQLSHICNELNAEGVLSPSDHYRVCNGEDDEEILWTTGPMKKMLTSPNLVGHSHLAGVTVRDDNGDPILMCTEPLVTDDERELLAAAIAAADQGPRKPRQAAPLRGVAVCWWCEEPLTSTAKNRKLADGSVNHHTYYRCPSGCKGLIPRETAEEEVERLLLDAIGDEQITEKVWVPGDSNETDLKAAVSALDELSSLAGTMTSRTAKDRLQRQIEALDRKIAELEQKPSREGRYEYRPTGQTYREAWDAAEDRRALLIKSGIKVAVGVHDGKLLAHPLSLAGTPVSEPS